MTGEYRLVPVEPLDDRAIEAAITAGINRFYTTPADASVQDILARAIISGYLNAAPQPDPPVDLMKSASRALGCWQSDDEDLRTAAEFIAAFAAGYAAEASQRDRVVISNLKGTARHLKERAKAAEQALAEEREACAKVAEAFGPSRPIVERRPGLIIQGRWEGEQAASQGIAAAIRARKGGENVL